MIKAFTLFSFIIIQLHADAVSDYIFKSSMNTTYDLVKNTDPKLWEAVKEWKGYFSEQNKELQDVHPTFFYFFTLGEEEGASALSLHYFNLEAANVKRDHPKAQFFGVMKGFPSDMRRMGDLFNAEAKSGNATKAEVKVKFFPEWFDNLNINQAPVYAFALCKPIFTEKEGCEFKYVARGAVGLSGFIDLMVQYEPAFIPYANSARGVK